MIQIHKLKNVHHQDTTVYKATFACPLQRNRAELQSNRKNCLLACIYKKFIIRSSRNGSIA